MLPWSFWICSWTHLLSEITSYLLLGVLLCKLKCLIFSFTSLSPIPPFYPPSPILIIHQLHFFLRNIPQILITVFYTICQLCCLFWKIFILLAVLLDTAACFLFLNAALIISFSDLESSPALYIPACCSTFKELSHLGDCKKWTFHLLYLLVRLGVTEIESSLSKCIFLL